MIALQHTCEPATAEHRLDILRQEEIDRRIEDAKYLPGGHRIGGHTPVALVKPRHVGLTRRGTCLVAYGHQPLAGGIPGCLG